MKYSGRDFSESEINWINDLVSNNPAIKRRKLSQLFCEKYDWRKINGGLKDVSCRVAFIKMEKDGLIRLPKAQQELNISQRHKQFSDLTAPAEKIIVSAGKLNIKLEAVNKQNITLWNEYIERYHYLGYSKLPGAQIRYFIYDGDDVVALLGFAAAAWKTKDRDNFIGWSKEQRERNLHLIINNCRFLILPWVNSRNLASKVLSIIARRLPNDWEERYNYRPILLETFVEKRFIGTSYKAANWICVGNTKGRGKKDVYNKAELPIKSIWVYPLMKDFRKMLCY
jgi:hypothetical protein